MYDLIIIGAGPAGLTASIYASCLGVKHLVVGKIVGGQMIYAPDILNYPGFDEISGTDLTQKMLSQVKKRGGEVLSELVNQINKIDGGFEILTESNKQYQTKTIILASGVERRKLNIPGEVEYTGKGIEYCATCGKFDYKDKIAIVIGGANSAAQSATQIAHSSKKVYIVYRGQELRCDPIWLDHIKRQSNIEIIFNATISEILGDGQKMTGVKIQTKNPQTQQISLSELNADKVFIEIGGVPGTVLLISLGVKMDSGGYISVDENLSTSVPGVYASGDVVSHRFSIEQITSAVGSAARAASSVFSFLKHQKAPTLWGKTVAGGGFEPPTSSM